MCVCAGRQDVSLSCQLIRVKFVSECKPNETLSTLGSLCIRSECELTEHARMATTPQ